MYDGLMVQTLLENIVTLFMLRERGGLLPNELWKSVRFVEGCLEKHGFKKKVTLMIATFGGDILSSPVTSDMYMPLGEF